MTLAVLAFSLVFGCVIALKLNQERAAILSEAEAERARTAAFLSERVSSSVAEVSAALSMIAGQMEALPPPQREAAARAALERLAGRSLVPAAALFIPDAEAVFVGAGDAAALRLAAGEALETGSAVRPGEAFPLTLAVPAPLNDGTVGALVAALDPQVLLPERPAGEAALLTSADGYLLAIAPAQTVTGAPRAAERLGLDPLTVSRTAENGGVLSGAQHGARELLLGAAAVAGAPIHALSLGPDGLNQAAWRSTLIFHFLLFIAPLGTAVALSIRLRRETDRLDATEARLRDSESRLRLAIESARCGVWDWDLETDDVVLTDSFAQLIGRPSGEVMTGPELLLLLRDEDRARVRASLRSAAQNQDVDLEVRAAGIAVWLQLRGRVMAGTRRIVGVAIDITERKGAQARVAAAESRLRAALESMTESFVLWDSRGRLILWNRKFRDFFGFGDDALKPGMSYAAVESGAARSVRHSHGEAGSDAYDLELADGRWVRYSERRTADGGLVSVGADITALKSQEAALRENDREMRRTVENLRRSQERVQELAENYEQEKIRAEEANRSKSEFLANMSHELRTPLNAINGFSEIMQGEMFGPLGHERYKDYVADILSSGQHLLSLINDILDMSKIEAGKMQLQPEPLDPGQLIEQCVRIMRARAEEKQIALSVEGDTLPEIEADPRALKQVLLNLMSNAVKFTPEAGKVVVRTFDAADGIVMQVADSGIGISEEDLPRVGRPFEQIENQHSKKHQGSGLGLALSKSLIELHGGTLRIDSVLGKGTTVSFSLPATAIIRRDDEAREEPGAETEPLESESASAP
ncbi:MAG: ATP-binding protein [Alphaproteobacteria bacterium]|nr:ATP-binding protein [Alphaproteobacteria bacterium]